MTIKDPEAGRAATAADIPEDDETLDWDVKRFGRMADHASDQDNEPATIPAGTGAEEGN